MTDQEILAILQQKYFEWKRDSEVFEAWFESEQAHYYLRIQPKVLKEA